MLEVGLTEWQQRVDEDVWMSLDEGNVSKTNRVNRETERGGDQMSSKRKDQKKKTKRDATCH